MPAGSYITKPFEGYTGREQDIKGISEMSNERRGLTEAIAIALESFYERADRISGVKPEPVVLNMGETTGDSASTEKVSTRNLFLLMKIQGETENYYLYPIAMLEGKMVVLMADGTVYPLLPDNYLGALSIPTRRHERYPIAPGLETDLRENKIRDTVLSPSSIHIYNFDPGSELSYLTEEWNRLPEADISIQPVTGYDLEVPEYYSEEDNKRDTKKQMES